MPDVSKLRLDNVTYDIKDDNARKYIANEASARASADITLQNNINTQAARIDQIASLPSGSTTGDAELLDIRVKADGSSASSAGNAVREQAITLNSNVKNLFDLSYLPFLDLTQGGLNSDGSDQSGTENRRVRSGYIPINSWDFFTLEKASNIRWVAYYFNENYVNIGSTTWSYNGYVAIPESYTPSYMRLVFGNSTNTAVTPYECAVSLIPVSKPAVALTEITEYKKNVIGLANRIEVPLIASLANNGVDLIASATRAVTDIFPIYRGMNYSIYATVNGDRAEALAIYYNENGSEISRGRFASSDLLLTPPNNAKAFRIYIRKNSSNATFVYTDKVYVYFNQNQKELAEVVSDLRETTERYTGETYPIEIEQGAFSAEGLNEAGTTRLRSTRFIPVSYLDNFVVTLKSNVSGMTYQYIVIYYSDNYYGIHEIKRTSSWLNSDTVQLVDEENVRFIRLYIKNSSGSTVLPTDVTVLIKAKESSIYINSVRPVLSQMKLNAITTKKKYQDIAVYNGDVFDFGEGTVSINGGSDISITNGHGNNCCFGTELHGTYPYLYCGSWNQDDCKIYVNQYQNGTFTLVRTIEYQTLSGYLNACVDEENEKIYIILNTSATTEEGAVDFIISDMQGNILSRKSLDNIPVIEGMTFYDGVIIVSSGHGINYPSYIHIFDTEGNLLSKSTRMNVDWDSSAWNDTIEGIDVDKVTGKLYIGLTTFIFKN